MNNIHPGQESNDIIQKRERKENNIILNRFVSR